MKWLIIPVLLAQTNCPIYVLDNHQAQATQAHGAIVSIQGVYEDGSPIRKHQGGVIWCEGDWWPVSAREEDGHGEFERNPKFEPDSHGVVPFSSRVAAPGMVCHAEVPGMAGTTRFNLAAGERRFEVITVR